MTVLVLASNREQARLACRQLGLTDPFTGGVPFEVIAVMTSSGSRTVEHLHGLIPDRIVEVLPELGEGAALAARNQGSRYLNAIAAKRDALEVERVFT